MDIAFIGGGNMGRAMATAAVETGVCPAARLLIVEPHAPAREQLAGLGAALAEAADARLGEAGLVVFAVKPQSAPEAFAEVKPHLRPEQTVLSIMAGVTLAAMREGLGTETLVRAMPNTPARIGLGMNVYHAAPAVPEGGLARVEALLRACGETLQVGNEDAIDAATAVSGSGPAYVFFLAEHWVAAARELGFSEAEATQLVQQTLRGATELWRSDTTPVASLREAVTSKGGTTAAALETFLGEGVDAALRRGIRRAYERAKELAR